jgi:IS66 Orf2 like protein
VFRGVRGNLIKILWHDGIGMSLYPKMLQKGRFIWPSPTAGVVGISASQLAYIRPKGPPLSIDCMICGTKMELTDVEPSDHRIVYTYRCRSARLQQLTIARLDVPGTAPRRHILGSGVGLVGRAPLTHRRDCLALRRGRPQRPIPHRGGLEDCVSDFEEPVGTSLDEHRA